MSYYHYLSWISLKRDLNHRYLTSACSHYLQSGRSVKILAGEEGDSEMMPVVGHWQMMPGEMTPMVVQMMPVVVQMMPVVEKMTTMVVEKMMLMVEDKMMLIVVAWGKLMTMVVEKLLMMVVECQ